MNNFYLLSPHLLRSSRSRREARWSSRFGWSWYCRLRGSPSNWTSGWADRWAARTTGSASSAGRPHTRRWNRAREAEPPYCASLEYASAPARRLLSPLRRHLLRSTTIAIFPRYPYTETSRPVVGQIAWINWRVSSSLSINPYPTKVTRASPISIHENTL